MGATCQPLCGRSVEVSWFGPFLPTVTWQAGCLSSIALLAGRSGYLLGTCVLMEMPASRQRGGSAALAVAGDHDQPPGVCSSVLAAVDPSVLWFSLQISLGPESHRWEGLWTSLFLSLYLS